MVGRLKNGTLEMDAPLSYRDHEESPSANTPLFSPAQDLSIIRKDTYWIESEGRLLLRIPVERGYERDWSFSAVLFADLLIISHRVPSGKKPYLSGPCERFNCQVRIRKLNLLLTRERQSFPHEARGIFLNLAICCFVSGLQKIAMD